MTITQTNWLANAQAGDKVALFKSGKGREVEISRVTPSMVMVGGFRFRKNGDSVGMAHVGSLRPLEMLAS